MFEAHPRPGLPPFRGRSPRRALLSLETLEGRLLLAASEPGYDPESIADVGPIAPEVTASQTETSEALDRREDREILRDFLATIPWPDATELADLPVEIGTDPPTGPPAAAIPLWKLVDVAVSGRPSRPVEFGEDDDEPDPPSPADVATTVATLPEAAFLEVLGQIGEERSLQVYNILVRPDAHAIRLRIATDPGGVGGGNRVWLKDAAGVLLGQWAMPEPGGGLSLTLQAAGPSEGGDPGTPGNLSVGIAHEPAGPFAPPPSAPMTYHLTIDEEPDPPAMTPVALPRPEAAASTSPVRLDVGLVLTFAPPSPTSGPGVASPATLPLRSAGPAAGVAEDGYPVPPVGRLDGVLVDLTLLHLAADGEAEVVDPLVTPVGTASGLSLVGAARPPEPDRADRASWEIATAQPEIAAHAEAPTATRTAKDSTARASGRRRAGAGVGLVVAAALSFGLMLPDLVIALKPTPPLRPLPWSRKARN